jgi:hypothetical protein
VLSMLVRLLGSQVSGGNPAAFISDVEQSNFMSFFPTITGDPTLYDYMEKKTGDKAGTGGAITIVDLQPESRASVI